MTNQAKAILLVISSGCMLATMDASAKYLGARLGVEQILWGRYFVHTIIMFFVLYKREQFNFLLCRYPKLQFLRSLSLLGATGAAYFALKHIPLGDATAIFFFAPVLVTVLSAVFLKEAVTLKDILLVLLGFCGVLIIIQPASAGFNWIKLTPLFSALMLAIYLLMTRVLQTKDRESATLFYSTFIGAIGLSLLVPFAWTIPNYIEASVMISMGVLGALGHFLLIKAFSFATASNLSPFLYSQLIFASILSVVLFGDTLTVGFVSGALLLVGCGLYQWRIKDQGKY